MSIQVYECPIHGEVEISLSMHDEVPQGLMCGKMTRRGTPCSKWATHVLKAPAAIIVEGGTGAGRGRRAE